MKEMKTFENVDEFRKAKLEERQKIYDKIIENFSDTALEAHVFGSSATGSVDEFSDIDFWATFSDDKLAAAIQNRHFLFKNIGEVLIYHEAQQNCPLGGMYSLLLFNTEAGPVHADIYFSPVNSARLWGETKILFNKDNLKIPEGEMVYDSKREKRDSQDRVKFIICMAFNGIKKIARKNDDNFLDFLVGIYNELRQNSFRQIELIENNNDFETVEKILENLSIIASEDNKPAIVEIQAFLNQVKHLYF